MRTLLLQKDINHKILLFHYMYFSCYIHNENVLYGNFYLLIIKGRFLEIDQNFLPPNFVSYVSHVRIMYQKF